MNSRPTAAALTLGAIAALSLSTAGPSFAAPGDDEATVSVFHGVPGLTVDVYANGEELLPNFEPGTLTDPLELPGGSYDIQVFADGEGPDGTPAIEKKVDVPAGANATLVAHLDASGKPALNAFVNDVSKVPAGEARLTVRHVAAAPAVDVRAGGEPVFEGLENPKEDKGEVPAGTVEADVTLAGTDTVAIGPADLDLAEGTNTVVYAWGSAEDDNLALKTQTIKDLHSAPGGVPAGETGEAATNSAGLPGWAYGAGGLAAIAVVAAGLRLNAVKK
ncbi:DUF4397 domain-containing protein [Streptomyces sp. NPDC060194]|uniref:DUF4397 domain-containing protein n=1 Tax=Streptomyces sp. NPDC060194 TaxID=3347069 RepID=UPI0036491BB8